MNLELLYIIAGILILPAIIFSLFAQIKVQTNFSKYKNQMADIGLPSHKIVERVLAQKGIDDVVVKQIGGSLTDNYNPKTKVISLSSEVYNSSSVAAIGVAMHECGHAIQYHENYLPMKLRNIVVPIANFSSKLLLPLVFIGMIFNFLFIGGILGLTFIWAGVIFYGIMFLLELITLPIEYNASSRAKTILSEMEYLTNEEMRGTSKVLSSAALTYFASMVVSLLYFLRFFLIILSVTRND